MTIEGRQLTYSDLKTKVTHQALLVRITGSYSPVVQKD